MMDIDCCFFFVVFFLYLNLYTQLNQTKRFIPKEKKKGEDRVKEDPIHCEVTEERG